MSWYFGGNSHLPAERTALKRGEPRSGQMLILLTLSLFFLFSLMGLSVDLGYSYFVKVYAQSAADSAATAAAIFANNNGYVCGTGIVCNTTYNCASPPTSPPTTPLEAGCLYASSNGFANTGNQSVSLIANNTTTPNESGNAPALWIQANVTQTVQHLFLFWSGFHSGPVAAQAIGAVSVTPASSCVYVIDPASTQGALLVSGAAILTASGCGVYVNSSHPTKALQVTGSASIVASTLNVHGGASIGGGAHTSPAPTTGAPVVADPLINLPAPAVSATCTHTNYSLTAGSDTIHPDGVYCGGITVANIGHLTMTAGTYILNGGGFNNANSGVITGSNVTIFLTGQNGQTPKPMSLIGDSVTTLTAPTAGTYQGILFYQDRNTTYGSVNTLGNSATLTATGSFYFPTTTLSLSGAVGTGTVAVVAKDFTLGGSATFTQDPTGTLTGLAGRNPGLIQ